jgi:lipooligosaccharide transport system permease protein
MTAALRVLEGKARAYRHTWKGTAVTTFVNPVLFLVAMGVALGSLVDRGAGAATLPGTTYLQFLAPGLLAASAMQTATSDSSWPIMAGMKWLKTFPAALATPISHRDLVAGHLVWVALRLVLATGAFALVMVLLGAATPLRAALATVPATITGLAFAGLVTAFSATLKNDYHLSSLFRFAIMPMFLFSGTFFPVSQLPAVLQPVAFLTPLWHGVQLTRSAALGVGSAWPAWVHTGYLLALFALGALLAVRAFHARLVV